MVKGDAPANAQVALPSLKHRVTMPNVDTVLVKKTVDFSSRA